MLTVRVSYECFNKKQQKYTEINTIEKLIIITILHPINGPIFFIKLRNASISLSIRETMLKKNAFPGASILNTEYTL